ncbi:coiled-coil domain containing 151-like [Saccoglossus kowalevskii]|uniref:Coiled-coil domain containing 151-like n=1 Tax=Saccoglossus kowalevskii TaxID=10224 RepID=A0ABM0GGU4_SACKO|nr:coiled-coil domain containing 151-like [Saccoglossus kowalevskii]
MPGAARGGNRAPITEQIAELQRKIALLDGDRKAYYESSQWTMKKNRETIAKMRKENKDLHKNLANSKAGDEKVINTAFHDRNVEKAALRGKSGKEAIAVMDQKVCEAIKKLNAMRAMTERKQRKLKETNTQLGQMKKDSADADAMDEGTSDEAQRLRALENRLDKANLKLHEAEHINRTYESIKEQMLGDALTFGNQLDETEQEIKSLKEELEELKKMNQDAQISRDAAKAELSKHEETVYREKRDREVALNELKKQAEEKKQHAERVERRLQRSSIQHDDLTAEQKQALSGEEQEKKISTYEEAFNAIKEATGVSDLAEVVARFESQEDTTKHLEELKKDSEKQLARLKEEKEKLQKEFEEMKYSGEAKLSSGQRMLEDFQSHLDAEETRRDEAFNKLDGSSKLLVNVKSGVEHLSDKLQHLKATKGHVPQAQLSPSSDEYVLDLLSQCEEKLLKLMEELDGKDVDETLKAMDEEEFHAGIEGSLPQYNTRIKLPTTQKDLVYDEDDDSGDDEDVITRIQLKKQAQQIVDSKTKKHKVRSRKKKAKA